MSKKIRNIFYLLSFFIFIVLTTIFYFSDQNVVKTNNYRTFYSVKLNEKISNLPLLKNDTSDIIEYRNDIEVYKKNKKTYIFWDLIKK
jgi:protocatechuate 3,4-dioxygenase beta subunit